jgi:hypothetical protein
MGEQVKNCGSCRWWEQTMFSGDLGWCGCPVPYAIHDSAVDPTLPHEGLGCPCFQPKPEVEE